MSKGTMPLSNTQNACSKTSEHTGKLQPKLSARRSRICWSPSGVSKLADLGARRLALNDPRKEQPGHVQSSRMSTKAAKMER